MENLDDEAKQKLLSDMDIYRDTLEKLGFGSRANDISEWMPAARDPALWAEIVEHRLGLVPGTYTKYKFRQTTISDSIFG